MPRNSCLAVDLGSVTTRVARSSDERDVVVSEIRSVVAIGPSGVRTGTAALQGGADDELLTDFVPLLAAGPAELAEAGWTSPTSPAEAVAHLLGRLSPHAQGPDDPVVVAVPDAWWNGVAGAEAREAVVDALAEVLGDVRVQIVARSVAAAAWWSQVDRPVRQRGTVLVCDIGAFAVTATLVRCAGTAITPVFTVDGGPPAGRAFERAAIGPRAAQAGPAALRDVDALRAAVTLGRRRAVAVTAAAATRPRYRETPVYEATGDPELVLTADDVERCFLPVRATIADTLDQVLRTLPSSADELDAVVVTGGFGAFPSAIDTVRSTMARSRGGERRPVVLTEGDSVVRGLLSIARGERQSGATSGLTLGVVVHRARAGRLEEGRVTVTRGGQAVEVTELVDVTEAGPPLEIEVGATDPQRRRCSAPILQAGRYRLGWWPARDGDGFLALRPVGGRAVLVPLVDFTAAPSTRKEPTAS